MNVQYRDYFNYLVTLTADEKYELKMMAEKVGKSPRDFLQQVFKHALEQEKRQLL